MKAGSFFPGTHYSSTYAMAGDDCSLHFELDNLSEKQKADHQDNVELTAMLQVATACIGHHRDHLALYEDYQKPEWMALLKKYHGFFTKMVDDVVPMANFSYHSKHNFYESVAKYVTANPGLTDVVNLYMSSGSNSVIHKDAALLKVNQNVNSKKHFAENAPGYGIPTPDTLVTTKAALDSVNVQDFFARHNNQIMVKLLGLAGARNVIAVDNIKACHTFVAEYADDMIVLLQERLPLDRFTEMTVDLVVTDSTVHIANVRKILFAEGLWVGNLIGDSVGVTPEHEAVLIKVGEYARSHGYFSAEGSNCGIDYFVKDDGSIIVTEINARWTGGLFPAEILRQIDSGGRDAVPFFDVVPVAKRDAYADFLEQHLVGDFEGDFAMVPIGFGALELNIDGSPHFYTWQMVLGDLAAFKTAKQQILGDGVLPTADIISLD